jgi:L-ascorbate metabolism protein UlaG (beta-lactamase superfamily)
MIPVGGTYTINAKQAVELINQIEPRLVIPMHYKVPGLKIKLEGVDSFCQEIGVCPTERLDKLKINKRDLPTEETRVVLMKSV